MKPCIISKRELCTTTKIIKAVIPDKRSAIRNPVISNAFLDTGLRRYDKISGFMRLCKAPKTLINVQIVILTEVKKLCYECNKGPLDFSEAFSVKMISEICFCSLK
ncbi:MAG TPA: hypothetical protein PK263_05685 [bacterium]|nr:hypothetical protein [bacterium]